MRQKTKSAISIQFCFWMIIELVLFTIAKVNLEDPASWLLMLVLAAGLTVI